MAFTKSHIALLLLDDDPNKTPLSNTKTEAIEWWSSLNERSKSKILRGNGFDVSTTTTVGWAEIVSFYKKIHNKL